MGQGCPARPHPQSWQLDNHRQAPAATTAASRGRHQAPLPEPPRACAPQSPVLTSASLYILCPTLTSASFPATRSPPRACALPGCPVGCRAPPAHAQQTTSPRMHGWVARCQGANAELPAEPGGSRGARCAATVPTMPPTTHWLGGCRVRAAEARDTSSGGRGGFALRGAPDSRRSPSPATHGGRWGTRGTYCGVSRPGCQALGRRRFPPVLVAVARWRALPARPGSLAESLPPLECRPQARCVGCCAKGPQALPGRRDQLPQNCGERGW